MTCPERTFRLGFALLLVLLAACQPAPAAAPTSTATRAIPTLIPSLTPQPTATIHPSVMPTATPAGTATPAAVGPANFPAGVNPLTGLKVSDPSRLDRLPVMVKVANFPRNGRPHAGLSFADMVFEYYIGDGENRFLALYYGQDAPKVGPVRSGRLVDAQLVKLYQGILGYVSADARVRRVLQNQLGSRAITLGAATCPALCDDGSGTVTSVFADTAGLSRYAAEKNGVTNQRPNLNGMRFDPRPPENGTPGLTLRVTYNPWSLGEWRYDPLAGRYLHWVEDVDASNRVSLVPLTDRLTGAQLAFDNVLVLFVQYDELSPTLHDIQLWYNQWGQKAILFRDGQVIEGGWKTVQQDRPLQLFLSDGAAMPLKPGNTWVILVGLSSRVRQVEPAGREIQFALP